MRERPTWRIVTRGGLARYETVWQDEPVDSATLTTAPEQPGRFARSLPFGRYRLEVTQPGGLAIAAVRFRSGWTGSDSPEVPDKVDVSADRAAYPDGATARIHIQSPFAGQASLAVLTNRLISLRNIPVREGANEVELPVDAAWGPGAYAAVTVFRPGAAADGQPRRALGLAWVALDPAPRRLGVAIEAPEKLRPRQRAEIPLRITGAEGMAHLTLAAVDEGGAAADAVPEPRPGGAFPRPPAAGDRSARRLRKADPAARGRAGGAAPGRRWRCGGQRHHPAAACRGAVLRRGGGGRRWRGAGAARPAGVQWRDPADGGGLGRAARGLGQPAAAGARPGGGRGAAAALPGTGRHRPHAAAAAQSGAAARRGDGGDRGGGPAGAGGRGAAQRHARHRGAGRPRHPAARHRRRRGGGAAFRHRPRGLSRDAGEPDHPPLLPPPRHRGGDHRAGAARRGAVGARPVALRAGHGGGPRQLGPAGALRCRGADARGAGLPALVHRAIGDQGAGARRLAGGGGAGGEARRRRRRAARQAALGWRLRAVERAGRAGSLGHGLCD
ncbi:hypothetical protein ACFFMP_16890 [Pseudoroseomonas cervicalis]|uniref:hypothetical protein n=1 Tax=Teichococcus cervicalis TaxID=204525 RepID=UPI0035EF633F